ncbi:uncharacterized protein LOC130589995 [Beta vulgaris subsp. vulgaris]|uniref:uncharacterized protein LOC130589995 n=1 Tax=Beta vulgaris subsp. vulgaris TaxID=3555 RepID=UPI002548D328|nr:uncharacterized protein LOC130589995 [Beta vulgaris subsp. vulgaris]
MLLHRRGSLLSSKRQGRPFPLKGMTLQLIRRGRLLTRSLTTRFHREDHCRERRSFNDSVVKRFISRPDIKTIRELFEEEEVEQLHSSWIDHSIRMVVMSHRHTAGFRKLRDGLKPQTELAIEKGLEIEQLKKDFEAERKLWAEEKATLEKKLQDIVSQRDSVTRT